MTRWPVEFHREPLYRRATWSTVTITQTSTYDPYRDLTPDLTTNASTPVFERVGDLWFGIRPWVPIAAGLICGGIGFLLGSVR